MIVTPIGSGADFALTLRFESQEEVQSFRNMLRHNTDLGRVIGGWQDRDPLANSADCVAVMDAIGVALYGEDNVPPAAVAAIPCRPVVPELPVTPEPAPSAIDYKNPPRHEGDPGTLTRATARVGMRVHSVHSVHSAHSAYGRLRGIWVIQALNDDGETMRVTGDGYIVDDRTPINRMFPVQGESVVEGVVVQTIEEEEA